MRDEVDTDNTCELIQGLMLEAGRLMEFESADLALVLPKERSLLATRIEHLHRTAGKILALAEAARALVRSLDDTAATI